MAFKDPIKPKYRKSSKNFIAPRKEQATTGTWMTPGDDYGVGFRVPVGKERVSSVSAVPMESKMFRQEEAINAKP